MTKNRTEMVQDAHETFKPGFGSQPGDVERVFVDMLDSVGSDTGPELGAPYVSIHDKLRYRGVYIKEGNGGADVGPGDPDAVEDDTARAQNLLEYFAGRSGGGIIRCPTGSIISETLEIAESSATIMGEGWGSSLESPYSSFLKWGGAAGVPMVLLRDGMGAGVEHIRLIGDPDNKPSAAIELRQTDGGHTHFASYLRRLWIGYYYALDDRGDTDNQFANGIIFTGLLNGDSNTLQHIRITACDDCGIDIQNTQALDTDISGLFVQFCRIGLQTKSKVSGSNWLFTNNSDRDIELLTGGRVYVTNFLSESSKRFFRQNSGSTALSIRGGTWQGTAGKVVDAVNGIRTVGEFSNDADQLLHLEDFDLTGGAGLTGTLLLSCKPPSSANAETIIVSGSNISPANLDFGTLAGANDSRNIIYRPRLPGSQDYAPRDEWSGAFARAVDRTYKVWRSDHLGGFIHRGGDLEVLALTVPQSPSITAFAGSGATTWSYRVTALTYNGEGLPSSIVSITNAVTLDATHVNRVRWFPVPGAYAYNIYRGTGAADELFLETVTWASMARGQPTFYDDGSWGSPSGALPTKNTTGNINAEGYVKKGSYTVALLPSASGSGAGAEIFVTDEAGGAVPAFSDGASWRRCTDRAVVS